ncbi:porin [Cupriavidus sp. DF5525]|uniref:porin n=1 Tax=Cupriavidus sp. DF5525 TaxID=3160989 RepID=UPI0032E03FBB
MSTAPLRRAGPISQVTARLPQRHGSVARTVAILALSLGQVPLSYAGVDLLGRMDVGVSAISNAGGHASTVMSSGITTPSFFALRGSDDLAGGTRALFHLQMNYQVDDGAQPLAVRGFSPTAYVGLASPTLGTP